MANFTWTPFFEELLRVICKDYTSKTLAPLLHKIFHDTSALTDKYKDGSSGPLKEIDPLTFIGYFNRSLTEERRIRYCKAVKEQLKLKSEVPKDFTGIPVINNQASWFFPYATKRTDDVFTSLWDFAKALDSGTLNAEVFSKALNIRGVGLSKLTQLCFICKPNRYIPLDKNTTEYLSSNGLKSELDRVRDSENFDDYELLLGGIKKKFSSQTMQEISAGAWKNLDDPQYWLVGATWSEEDKSSEFIEKSEWINGFTQESGDKSLDRVKEVAVGDWIAIKSAFVKERRISCVRIKAVGRVTENAGDGRHLKVDWIFRGPSFDVDGAAYMQTIHKVRDSVDQKLIFNNSFKSSKKESGSTSKEADIESNGGGGIDLPKNLILYGPPGVGKTHKILELRQIFTSDDASDDSARINRWVSDQSWRTVIFAAMLDLNKIVSVSEIQSHPFVQAKVQQSSNKTPKNTIWSHLQKHTVKESKTVKFQERVEPLVFDKTEDSKWFLTGDWSELLSDIQEEVEDLRSGAGTQVKRFEVITFHQSYSYEDFVEGIRPITNEESDSIRYSIESGIFKRMCERAKSDPENSYALFIDEINRGNISKIFGELITLVEDDKRAGSKNATSVVLPYSKTEFSVPSNLHIVGTMNSVDRSIALLDIALRRRFRFQRINPNPEIVVQEVEGINFRLIYEEINDRLSVLLGEDYQIGHSYFMQDRILSAADLKVVWFDNLLPLLQEYFFDDWEKLKAIVPTFIEESQIKGLSGLGLLNTSKFRFTPSSIADEDFVERMQELSTRLRAA